MNIWQNLMYFHGDIVITSIVTVMLFLGIAMLFFRNYKEHSIILDLNNHDMRKKTDIILTDKKNKKGYQTKNYRGTDIETAAWEDSIFEKQTGKMHTENAENILDDEPQVEDFKMVENLTKEHSRKTENKMNNVSRPFLDSIIVEINSNYKEHGISSGLKTTSFEEKLVHAKQHAGQGKGAKGHGMAA